MKNTSNTQPATATALTGANQTLTGSYVFLGITAADEGASAIKVHVYHGTSDNGAPIAVINAQSGNGASYWYGPNGIACPNGVYIKVYSGTPAGTVFTR